MSKRIPVFLSVGTVHNEFQQRYLRKLVIHLRRHGIEAETLGQTFWSIEQPLRPVRKKMQEVDGAVILAMERFHSKEGIYKEGSPLQKIVGDQYFTTVWTHIEAAMAYQLDLPILILKEEKLTAEGVFDRGVHEWIVIEIHPEHPKEITEDPIMRYIDSWICLVKEHFRLKQH